MTKVRNVVQLAEKKPLLHIIARMISNILILSISLLAFTGCGKKTEVVPDLLDPVQVKMDTEKVVKDTIYDIDLYEGSVVPYTQGIYFEQDTLISEVVVGVGDFVKKGDPLIKLDRTEWRKQVSSLEDDISDTEKNNDYSNQQLDYDIEIAKLQLEALKATGSAKDISLKELDLQKLELQLEYNKKLQKLDLDKKKEQLYKLNKQLNQSDLFAPFDGTVVYMANLHEGSKAQAFNPIIYMADDSKITVQTDYIPSDTLKNSHDTYALIGDKKYSITNVPYTPEEYKYKVYNKLTLKSNFSINDMDKSITSGMYAAICFTRNYAENVLTIPKKALYRDGSTRYVYKIVNGERIRQEVEIGMTTRLMAEIKSGLNEGDEVYVQQ